MGAGLTALLCCDISAYLLAAANNRRTAAVRALINICWS